MGMEYRGSRVSEPADIIRLLDARAKAEDVTDESLVNYLVSEGTTNLVNKGTVDSAFNGKASTSDVTAAYANKATTSDIGTSLFTLDGNGQIPAADLPTMSTRGAKYVAGGSVSAKTGVGDGGIFGYTTQLARLTFNGSSLMGGRPYHLLGFAQIETKSNAPTANPVVYVSTNSSGTANAVGTGHGIPGREGYHHVTVSPTQKGTPQVHTGNIYVYLTCKTFNGTADYSDYYPFWGVIGVPITN